MNFHSLSVVIPKIFDFIDLIDNAKFVITDSFHATAFSLNLNTMPFCIYPKKYSSRISDFLKLLDAENCHVESFQDFDILNRKIDFNKINLILDNERKKVDKFLNDIVRENKGEK